MKATRIFPLMLAGILQVAPMARTVLPQIQAIAPSAWAMVFRLSASAIAMFGYHAISGASTAVVSPSTASATTGHTYTAGAGTAIYTMSTAPDVAGSWSVSPNPPAPGVSVSNQYWVGTPTTPGVYTVTITGWEFAAQQGLSTSKNVTLTVIGSPPTAPSNLSANAVSSSQINLSWTDNSSTETSFKIFRAITAAGPWNQVNSVGANVVTYSDTGINPSTTYYYQVSASSSQGDSANSSMAFATTVNIAPVLPVLTNRTVLAASNLTFTVTATDVGQNSTNILTDFEAFASGTANGTVMFRDPKFAASTTNFLDKSLTYTSVTNTFPATHSSTRVLVARWGFTNTTTAPWLQLATTAATSLPNPVINLNGILTFDVYTTGAIKLGLGVRETNSNVAYGGDGGTNGTVEWVGVSGTNANSAGSATPIPTRTIAAGSWQTVQFNLPQESVTAMTGDGVLSTTTGEEVLDHLAIVPVTPTINFTNYFDNFTIINTNQVLYRLGAGSPSGAAINRTNGVFSWTPAAGQAGSYAIAIIATDNGVPNMSATQTVNITVTTSNTSPKLTAIPLQFAIAGQLFSFTNTASDSDIPAQTLTFSLGNGAPAGLSVDPASGIIFWTPATNITGSHPVTVIVTDNGTPPLSTNRTFNIVVGSPNIRPAGPDGTGNLLISFDTIPQHVYQIAYKVSLSDADWTQLGTNIVAGGSGLSTPVPIGPEKQRFYQIFEVR